MSECVLLSRPTRVLSVIPVTGALFHWEIFHGTYYRSPEFHWNSPPLPPNLLPQRAAGPKNGITWSAAGYKTVLHPQ